MFSYYINAITACGSGQIHAIIFVWEVGISLLFTNVAEDLNSGQPRTNPASDQSGT